jgi:hypothetical protein
MGRFDLEEHGELVVPVFVFVPADRRTKRLIFNQLVSDGCIQLPEEERQKTVSITGKTNKASHWK